MIEVLDVNTKGGIFYGIASFEGRQSLDPIKPSQRLSSLMGRYGVPVLLVALVNKVCVRGMWEVGPSVLGVWVSLHAAFILP